jgi:hypothetical protein
MMQNKMHYAVHGRTVNGVPLISNRLDEKYQSSQKALGAGWYLMTNNCIERKKQIIERIAKAFDIKLCVEIM